MDDTLINLKKLKVVELRDKCVKLGLETKGTKQALIDRISQCLGVSSEAHLDISMADEGHGLDTSQATEEFAASEPNVEKTKTPSPTNSLEIHASDTEKAEVELDFVNEEMNSCDQFAASTFKSEQICMDLHRSNLNLNDDDWDVSFPVKYMDHVHLDPYVSDLHFQISDNHYLQGSSMNNEFADFYCGVKGTHGFSSGYICFSCKFIDILTGQDGKPLTAGLCVGFSGMDDGLHLGDSNTSFGYDSSGNVVFGNKIVGNYNKFNPGDTVVAMVNLQSNSLTFTFQLNNVDIGHSTTTPLESPVTLFPHVYFKNCKFLVNFKFSSGVHGSLESISRTLIPGPRPPKSFSDCEVIMMVGIIAAGKSTWVKQFLTETSKRYYIIGRSLLFDRWRKIGDEKVPYLSERLVSKAISKMIALSTLKAGNYILDQTNVNLTSRKKRVQSFEKFGIKKAVVIVPRLAKHAIMVDSYKAQSQLPQADSRSLHLDELAEYKANFTLPTKDEGFSEIIYVDVDENVAKEIVADYKYDAERFKEMKKPEKPVEKRPRILPPESRQNSGVHSRLGQQTSRDKRTLRKSPISFRRQDEPKRRGDFAMKSKFSETKTRFERSRDSPPRKRRPDDVRPLGERRFRVDSGRMLSPKSHYYQNSSFERKSDVSRNSGRRSQIDYPDHRISRVSSQSYRSGAWRDEPSDRPRDFSNRSYDERERGNPRFQRQAYSGRRISKERFGAYEKSGHPHY